MNDGAMTAREAGEILSELRMIRERLDKMDERLDAGDKRFREMDRQEAADGVVKAIALKVGGWVIFIVGSVGLAILSHVPFIAEWLLPPKGH